MMLFVVIKIIIKIKDWKVFIRLFLFVLYLKCSVLPGWISTNSATALCTLGPAIESANNRIVVSFQYANCHIIRMKIFGSSQKLLTTNTQGDIQCRTIAINFGLIYYINGYFRVWLTSMNIDPKCHAYLY